MFAHMLPAIVAWLTSRGWNHACWYDHIVSIRGPWRPPEEDDRPVFWWDGREPLAVFEVMAPVVGLPASRLREDFRRYQEAMRD